MAETTDTADTTPTANPEDRYVDYAISGDTGEGIIGKAPQRSTAHFKGERFRV